MFYLTETGPYRLVVIKKSNFGAPPRSLFLSDIFHRLLERSSDTHFSLFNNERHRLLAASRARVRRYNVVSCVHYPPALQYAYFSFTSILDVTVV